METILEIVAILGLVVAILTFLFGDGILKNKKERKNTNSTAENKRPFEKHVLIISSILIIILFFAIFRPFFYGDKTSKIEPEISATENPQKTADNGGGDKTRGDNRPNNTSRPTETNSIAVNTAPTVQPPAVTSVTTPLPTVSPSSKPELEVLYSFPLIDTIEAVNGNISAEGQKDLYCITPISNGRYRFELSNVSVGVVYSFSFLDSNGQSLNTGRFNNDTYGFTLDLTAGEQRYIQVRQVTGFGQYTLTIGTQNEYIDISDIASIDGSIQFEGQRNIYIFTVPSTSTYIFELTEMPGNSDYFIGLCTSSDAEFGINTVKLSDGHGISVPLTEGTTYYVRVSSQNSIFGSYKLNITKK